jgi:hypothetical protein
MDDMMLMIGPISDWLFILLVYVIFDGRHDVYDFSTLVVKTVSQGSDESLNSCPQSEGALTSSINSQSEIGPIINMMLLIKGHTH